MKWNETELMVLNIHVNVFIEYILLLYIYIILNAFTYFNINLVNQFKDSHNEGKKGSYFVQTFPPYKNKPKNNFKYVFF